MRRRVIGGVVLALVLAAGTVSIVGPDICQWLTPGSVLWKLCGCDGGCAGENSAAGGGCSGAG